MIHVQEPGSALPDGFVGIWPIEQSVRVSTCFGRQQPASLLAELTSSDHAEKHAPSVNGGNEAVLYKLDCESETRFMRSQHHLLPNCHQNPVPNL